MPTLSQKLNALPQAPGVYIFKNAASEILYVGKAASLKDRVGSYFQTKSGAVRTIEMYINEITDLETRRTDTVLEAYILEQSLIKKLQPKYNAMGKDDKSFAYVLLTKEDFPRFVVMRATDVAQISNFQFPIVDQFPMSNYKISKKIPYSKIYGPYTSRRQIETALKILRKIFPYHNRPEQSEFRCFDYHLGLCPGPYDGKISKKEYAKNIRAIRMILEGKKGGLLNKMKKEMEVCSEKEDYECAARVRNRIFALQHIQDIALITKKDESFKVQTSTPFRIEGYDISNISGKYSVGSMVVFDTADGELRPNKSQYRKFKIKTLDEANDVGAMEEILMRRFKNNWPRPNLILLDGGAGHLNMARRVLRIYKIEIPLLAVAKGPERKKLDLRSFGAVPELSKNIIEQVRDEAHRFAIGYHRKVRGREIGKYNARRTTL